MKLELDKQYLHTKPNILRCCTLAAGETHTLLQAVVCDYKRLIMLGFRKRDLNMAFNAYSSLPFVCSTLCTATLLVCLIHLLDFCREAIWFEVVLLIVESLTYIGASYIAKRQVWRA